MNIFIMKKKIKEIKLFRDINLFNYIYINLDKYI